MADPIADGVVRDLLAAGRHERVGDLMRALTDPSANGLPHEVHDHFECTRSLPSWADERRIVRGQELFTRYGWLMAAGFFKFLGPSG